MQRSFWLKTRYIPLIALGLLLGLVAVACGSATAPETIIEERIVEKEVIKEVIKEVEKEVVVEREIEKIVIATPIPVPTPYGGIKQVDHFTIMQASLGNEIFNSRNAYGENNMWVRLANVWIIGTNKNLELDPTTGVASSWKLTDGGKAWEFTIKEGIKFHNGEELNADDVAFSLDWALNEGSISSSIKRVARQLADDQKVRPEKTGPNTVKITFQKPLAFFSVTASELDNSALNMVISKDYWDSFAAGDAPENCEPVAWCRSEDGFESAPGPGTAGPFELVTHLRSEELIYERFDDYFARDQRPYPFKTVSLRAIPEISTRVAALRAGAADIIDTDLSVVNQIERDGGQVIYGPESIYIWLRASNCDLEVDLKGNPIMCSDKRVRHALDYALDKTLIQALYGGPSAYQVKGTPTISPSGLGYEAGLDPFPYDPDLARQLLAEAGYPGGEGFNGGRPFSVHTWTGAGAPLTVELSTLVCDMWNKELGIDCKINVGDEVVIKQAQSGGEIPGEYVIRTNEINYDSGRRMLGRYGTDGYIGYDPPLGAAVDAAMAEVDPAKRHAAYFKAHEAAMETHFDFSTGYMNLPYGVSSRIESWEPWPLAPYASALWTVRFK